MEDPRLISISDDDETLGSFADENEVPADTAESRHFFGPSPPDRELAAQTAHDWPLNPRPIAASPTASSTPPSRRIALPNAAVTPPQGVWRYAPGWKTVAVLALLLAIQGGRLLIPVWQQAVSQPPTFTLADIRPNSTSQPVRVGPSSTPTATGPVPAPPVASAPATAPAPAARVEPAPAERGDRARESATTRTAVKPAERVPAAPVRNPSPPAPAAANTRASAPAPSRVGTPPPGSRQAAGASPVVATRMPTPEPRPSAARPTPPPAASAPAPSAVSAPPAASPTTAVTTTRPTPQPANAPAAAPPPNAAPAAAPPAANANNSAAVRTTLGDESAVRFVLERYRSAYSTLNANDAKAVWPGVDAKTLSKAFDQLQSQDLQFTSCQVALSGDRANATCGGLAAWVPKVGSRNARSAARQWNFNLQRDGDRWLIAGVNMR